MPDSSPDSFAQAVQLHRDGNFAAAEPLYRQVLAADPGNLDAEYLLGTALLQLGRFEPAIEHLQAVCDRRPDVPDAHNNLGVACKAIGDWERAARAFQAAIKARPEYQQALFNLGAVMEQRRLFADAEKCYRHALRLQPDDAAARLSLANVLKAQKKWGEAEAEYGSLGNDGTRDEERLVNLAYVLARQEKLDEAAGTYRILLDRRPDFAEIHSSLSFIFERQGKLDEAVAAARRAIECRPELPDAWNNLGIAYRSQHRLEDARSAFQMALQHRPDFALSEFNLGTTHLLAGKYRAGWPGYEKRTAALGLEPRTFPQPRWNGGPIAGRRLFVFSDQGFGDAIQFARFLETARRRCGAEIVLECQEELVALLNGVAGVDEVLAEGSELPAFDSWLPLASVPGLLEVTPDSLGDVPYLSAPRELRKELSDLLESLPGAGPKVGIVWRGNPEQARDVVRSCSPAVLQPLLETPDVHFVSLQTGPTSADDLSTIPRELRPPDVGAQLRDFRETAGVIGRLDLVISVDTATAHLAGALGADVWTLLPHTPDWRWGLRGETTPWYATMRLFRQHRWGDWDGVVARLKDELQKRRPA